MAKRKPRTRRECFVIQTQAAGTMKTALESRGFEITAEQWDGPVQVERFVAESRGAQLLVTVHVRPSEPLRESNAFDPMDWERVANRLSPISLNPERRK